MLLDALNLWVSLFNSQLLALVLAVFITLFLIFIFVDEML